MTARAAAIGAEFLPEMGKMPTPGKYNLQIGTLVWFDGDEYTPRLVSKRMGVVVGKSIGDSHIPIYKVFWFTANKYTNSFGGQLLPIDKHDTYEQTQYQKMDYPSVF
jgi:hypothetical protein